MRRHRVVRVGLLVLLAMHSGNIWARSSGIVGFSGNPATNGGAICNVCHSGGVTPTVALSGPTTVGPGTVHTYSLTISGGQEVAGGFNVSADAGELTVVDPGTQLISGEVTHTQQRSVNAGLEVVFQFNWTAPATTGPATLYGAGNSVNFNFSTTGDAPGQTSLQVAVTDASPSPGESSAREADPLLVTSFDRASGDLSLSFETGCETTNNNVYFGPLSLVSGHAWSGAVCNVGTSGATDPLGLGSGDVFFVIVGVNDLEEGSYGTASLEAERTAFVGSPCGQEQNLADTCDAM